MRGWCAGTLVSLSQDGQLSFLQCNNVTYDNFVLTLNTLTQADSPNCIVRAGPARILSQKLSVFARHSENSAHECYRTDYNCSPHILLQAQLSALPNCLEPGLWTQIAFKAAIQNEKNKQSCCADQTKADTVRSDEKRAARRGRHIFSAGRRPISRLSSWVHNTKGSERTATAATGDMLVIYW